MNYKRIWRKHNSVIVFGGAIAISLLFGYNDIRRNMLSLSTTREFIATNNMKQARLEEQIKFEQQQAKIAEARYTRGCTIVVAVSNPRNLATLVEGEPVLDRTTSKYLPAGTVVCDSNGNTAVLRTNEKGVPVARDLAFTGNRQLAINTVRKIKGAKVYYVTPSK